VEGVDHVEHVRLPESHFALFRFFIIEMRPEEKTNYYFKRNRLYNTVIWHSQS
jgi:hypothetical protein